MLGTILIVSFLYTQIEYLFSHVEETIAAEKVGVNIEDFAPNIVGDTLNGESFELEKLKGKKVILNFFATWCYPCQEEMPLISRLIQRLPANEIEFVAINLTSQENSIKDITPFLNHFKAELDPVLDVDGDIMNTYRIIGIPTTFILDEEGMIIERVDGPLTKELIERVLSVSIH
ncbi:thiol-disulfide oxidoreductase [Bacillus sp. TS-2]|nr:thiol-disulfide oxidoreductase [Bacillus sp. TS-2]